MKTHSSLPGLLVLACLTCLPLCSRATTLVVTNLADSGPGTLRSAVALANTNAGGADLTFAPALGGQTITLTSGQLTLSNQLTLTSPAGGLAISGDTHSRVFEVASNAVVTIQGFLLKNGYTSGDGGAVQVDDGGRLTIINSTVSDSSAGHFGGGILNRGTLLLRDSTVELNVASGTGGGIRNEGTLTGTNCYILGNSANNGGGVVTTNLLTADRWTVSGNWATHNTGGIENDRGTLTITNSTISGNSATNDGGGLGNYKFGTVTVSASTISGNSAANNGGGVMIGNGGVTITKSSFTSNSAIIYGGGIYNNATLTINNSTLSENATPENGGGIANNVSGTLRINNSTFTRNSAGSVGGGIENDGTNILNNCTLSGNSATQGGGIFLTGGRSYLTNVVVAGNTAGTSPNIAGPFSGANNLTNGVPLLAPLGNYGGPTRTMPPLAGSPAIDAGLDSVTNFLPTDQRGQARRFGSHVDIGAAEFRSFVVRNANDSGPGSLRGTLSYGPDRITFASTLAGHTINLSSEIDFSQGLTIDASSLPGGITLSGGVSRVLEIGSRANVFLNSLTLRDGIAPGGSYPTNCGGGILNLGRLTLDNCTVQNNLAVNGTNCGGGGIENDGAMLSASNCLFTGNSAMFGGGIRSEDGSQVTLNQCTFSGNSATSNGGGVFNRGTLLLRNSTVERNVAFGNGGGIRNEGTLTGTNCFILGNSAYNGGGVVTTNLLTADRWTVSGNRATFNTGGIENDHGILTISNSIISGNSATNDGGGLGNYAFGTVTVSASAISGNSAFYGGGLMINNGGVAMANSSFTSNSANFNGGGIYNAGTLTINNSTFTRNSGGFIGGGIFNSSTNILNNCTLSGNSASQGGGIFLTGGRSYLTNVVVAGNTAGTSPNIAGPFSGANNLTNGVPLLAPLGNYGGPTQTMPPLAGSPAIDAGDDSVTSFLTTDQRGYPRKSGAHVDIGAVEAQYAPANNPPLLMNAASSGIGGNHSFEFTFTNVPNADFTVLGTTNLALPLTDWIPIGNAAQNLPGQYQFTDPGATNDAQRFYRVVSP